MITIIVAHDPNRVIGRGNELVWHYPEDMKHFRRMTSGNTIIMGRKTFESLPNPLPNRTNVVITRSNMEFPNEVVVFDSLIGAIQAYPDAYVIGGEEIYRQSLELADRIIVSHIEKVYQGDKFFPELGPEWVERSREHRDGFCIVEYFRDNHP